LVRERQLRIVGVNKSQYLVLLGFCHIVQQKIYIYLLQNYYDSLPKVSKSRSKNMLFFICNLIYKINNIILVIEK